MATALANFLNHMPSPLVLVVAGYIGLRSLEVALRPEEAFRTRIAHRMMTTLATGLFLTVVLFLVSEILRAAGVIALPWPSSPLARC